jgi:hypothetical protein
VTRPAPLGPEVHQNGLFAVQNALGKVTVAHFDGFGLGWATIPAILLDRSGAPQR